MTNRERVHAILSYEKYDHMPIVDFGFNSITLETWHKQGHLTDEDLIDSGDGGAGEKRIEKKLGFDFNWQGCLQPILKTGLFPFFEKTVIERFPDGIIHMVSQEGTIVGVKEGISCIPQDVGTLLKGRKEWEELFLPKLQFSTDRIAKLVNSGMPKERAKLQDPRGIHCGSLYGSIRDMIGVQELAYLQADDEDLYYEIIDTIGNLGYSVTKAALETGFEGRYLLQNRAAGRAFGLPGKGRPALPAHYVAAGAARRGHRVSRLRRLHRRPHPRLA
jgi:uroporphyrinogen decarboxylase